MFAIACDRGSRRKICGTPGCGRECEALCDYPVKRKGKDATCDAKLCDRCRVRQPQDRDFCPAHERVAFVARCHGAVQRNVVWKSQTRGLNFGTAFADATRIASARVRGLIGPGGA